MASTHKGTVTLYLGAGAEPQSVPALLTASGRWAIHRHTKHGKSSSTVTHVPTGIAARWGMTATQARQLALDFEEVATPHLDALGFGQLTGAAVRDDLHALIPVMHRVLGF